MSSKSTQEIKDKCGKFRILIIGRANAGKTTILQRVCDTTDDPEIYNKNGEKMDHSVLAESAGRGEHDIDNEMVFKANPGFRFHDSRGFEAGGTLELDKVKAFIAERSQQTKLENQLHAIWYCIPVDDSRPFTAAENQFFSVCGTGNVPVIAIFTKFDALDTEAFATLRRENLSRADAKRKAPERATADFEQTHLVSLRAKPYPPKGHACLRDMNKPGANCSELIKQTAAALDDEVMQQLFVSTQRNNLELCAKYALERIAIPKTVKKVEQNPVLEFFAGSITKDQANSIAKEILAWFPHFNYWLIDLELEGREELIDLVGLVGGRLELRLGRRLIDLIDLGEPYERLKEFIKSSVPARPIILLSLAVTISAIHSYFLWAQNGSRSAFTDAVQLYAASPQCQAVARAVEEIDITKSSLERDVDKWKTETLEILLQIVRDNRLGA